MAANDKLGCLGFLLKLLGFAPAPGGFPYRVRDDFLTRAEASFFKVLQTAVGSSAAVFAKVRLGDLFFVPNPSGNVAYVNRISSKHVDFLICDADSLRPILGIELDDSSHQRASRQERDAFFDQVFEAAGLPLLRLPARKAYSVQEVRDLLTEAVSLGADNSGGQLPPMAGEIAAAVPPGGPPLCPKCGIPMELRRARRGPNQGGEFWGCRNYPRCHEMINI